MSPHQPFRYDSGCARRPVPVEGEGFSGEERAQAYANDVRCLSGDLVTAVDRIRSTDPEAIILLQSDHGSKLSVDWSRPFDQWSDDSLRERFAVLDARRLPSGCDAGSDEAALVNTFRVVLACIEGHPPELVAPKSFWTGFEDLRSIREVTDEVR
jgi:hypothetical protein